MTSTEKKVNAYWNVVGKDECKRPVIIYVGVDGRIIFNESNKYDEKAWKGLIWIRTETFGRLL